MENAGMEIMPIRRGKSGILQHSPTFFFFFLQHLSKKLDFEFSKILFLEYQMNFHFRGYSPYL